MPNILTILLWSIPFSAIPPLLPLGELSRELYVYVALALAPFIIFPHASQNSEISTTPRLPKYAVQLVMALLLVTLFTTIANISTIATTELNGRTGLNKLITATAVIIFGLLPASIAYHSIRNSNNDFRAVIAKPLLIITLCMAPFVALEIASWYIGSAYNIYTILSQIVHAGATFEETPFRLRATTAEPSMLALFIATALPFSLAYQTGPQRLPMTLITTPLLLLMAYASASRTAFITVGIMLPTYLLLCSTSPMITRTIKRLLPFIFLLPPTALLLLLVAPETATDMFQETENLSNLTRFATIIACVDLFRENWFAGVGLGQTASELQRYLPSWAYSSYEIIAYVDNVESTRTIPIYGMFARLAAELGVIGIAIWYGFMFKVTKTVAAITTTDYEAPQTAILLLLTGLIALDFCTASFRMPLIWITLGAASAYLSTKPSIPA